MSEPERGQWQIRCAFNAYCKRTLKNEAVNAQRDVARQQMRRVSFSDLTPQEENQLAVCDEYFTDDEAEQSFSVAGREIPVQLLADALRSLPEEKRSAILLYYFSDMTDAEIAKRQDISRSTAQRRRTSSLEMLKRYLEEHTDEQ